MFRFKGLEYQRLINAGLTEGLVPRAGVSRLLIAKPRATSTRCSGPDPCSSWPRSFERLKTVLEPVGAAALAALVSGRLDHRSRRVGVITAGDNVNTDRSARLLGG